MMDRLRASLSWVVVICAMGAFADNVPASSDLATMHDYFYYTTHASEGRANHTITAGGTYSLSADKVWSSLTIAANIGSTTTLNLGGHTFTCTGCDWTSRPIIDNINSPLVIKNGTLATVYDPKTYPWTWSNPDWYQFRRGMHIASSLTIAGDAVLNIENGASGTSAVIAGTGTRVVVEDGGVFNARIGFGGVDNRFVFKKGSTFSKISAYVASAKFPQNIWYESGYVSNVIEICDSQMLKNAGITSLTPDANAKAGSYHCGLSVSSPDFNWTGGGLTVGNQGGSTGGMIPVLFEMKDGAKYTSSGEFHIGNSIAAGGSLASLDGEGTLWKATTSWAGRVGSATGASNNVLRISNGAFFDATAANFSVGYSDDSSHNAIEVLAGGHFATASLNVGRVLNWGNSVLVSGEGSTMSNTYLNIGNTVGVGGGNNTVTADDHGSIYIDGNAYVGYGGSRCSLIAKNGGKITTRSGVALAVTEGSASTMDKTACNYNRLEAINGGEVYVGTYIYGHGNNSEVIISNGTVSTIQLFVDNSAGTVNLGTNNLVVVSGRYGYLEVRKWGVNLMNGGTIKIEVPKNGFADYKDKVRAPINITGGIKKDDASKIVLDVSEFVSQDSNVSEAPLIYCSGGIPSDLVAKIDLGNSECRLRRSADGKTLTLLKPCGFLLIYR